MIEEKYLEIIDKHLGEKLFAVYVMDGIIKTRYGKLTETYSSKYTIHETRTDKEVKINYFNDADNYTVALYNFYCVDLLKGKTPLNMQGKMKLSTLSSMITPKLKENLNDEITVINFDIGKFWKSEGYLADMGMRDLIVSTGKNATLNDRIPYNNIIHIFDKNSNDLIAT